MNPKAYRADGLLLLTALIWGTGFVAQRLGMEAIGPMLYNGSRFALGTLVVLPMAIWSKRRPSHDRTFSRLTLGGGILAGLVLFIAASLQQIGLKYTSVANAGFITGLYVIIVPLLGLFLGHRIDSGCWIGAALAVLGMYLLSVSETFTIAFGDLLQLGGALFWAVHLLLLAAITPRCPGPALACLQFVTCAFLCLALALAIEPIIWADIVRAAPAVTYGGILAVGIGYTLQVVAQKEALPTHAAIILSLEAVFATLAGWLVLNETLTARAILGCGMMLAGMLVAQLLPFYHSYRPI